MLVAPNAEAKQRWFTAIQHDYEAFGAGRRKDNCPAALIAPIRRRHMSLMRTKSGNALEMTTLERTLYGTACC